MFLRWIYWHLAPGIQGFEQARRYQERRLMPFSTGSMIAGSGADVSMKIRSEAYPHL